MKVTQYKKWDEKIHCYFPLDHLHFRVFFLLSRNFLNEKLFKNTHTHKHTHLLHPIIQLWYICFLRGELFFTFREKVQAQANVLSQVFWLMSASLSIPLDVTINSDISETFWYHFAPECFLHLMEWRQHKVVIHSILQRLLYTHLLFLSFPNLQYVSIML